MSSEEQLYDGMRKLIQDTKSIYTDYASYKGTLVDQAILDELRNRVSALNADQARIRAEYQQQTGRRMVDSPEYRDLKKEYNEKSAKLKELVLSIGLRETMPIEYEDTPRERRFTAIAGRRRKTKRRRTLKKRLRR